MNNYRLIIQYDGTGYSGWQIQQNSETVQQKVTGCIEIILKQKVNLIGSGRTDSGVHAFGQTANFRTEDEIDIYRFTYSLNSILPQDISIMNMEKTSEDFHSRFDAKKRSYFYFIAKHKSPFFDRYSYFYHNKININKLNHLSKFFLGTKDFTSFCRAASDTENKICHIYDIHWKENKELIFFYIEADRFLHGMVRTLIGTLLKVCGNDQKKEYLGEILSSKNREAAGEAVPAKGLFLYKVKY